MAEAVFGSVVLQIDLAARCSELEEPVNLQ